MKKKIIVVGSGFAGLSSAAILAKNGFDVTILEKNTTFGGRARQFKVEGFTFDMGPSWYWMPEVFEDFYNIFGKSASDFYELTRLDPSYRIYFDKQDYIDIPATYEELLQLFESIEQGAGKKLHAFLEDAKYKYEVGMNEFVWKPSHSIVEFMDIRIAKSALKLDMFTSISKSIRKLFKNPRLRQILEFPVLFLGATPEDTPALYSLMNYADLKLGTWYPQGGMYKVIDAMISIAKEQGVKFISNAEVVNITSESCIVKTVNTKEATYDCDAVINTSDYYHFDQNVLSPSQRKYTKKYWDTRVMAPSSLLFYIGLNKKLDGIKHHSLFFDESFELHAKEIYKKTTWPSKPLFYTCCPSVTDSTVAPENSENLFLLMPIAPDLEDTDQLRVKYFNIILERLQEIAAFDIKDSIVYKKSYCVHDFKNDYNAFKGNAYGLANVLTQTAFLKPKMKSHKLDNLFYAGQLTTPGPGVPPSIISGQVAAAELMKSLN